MDVGDENRWDAVSKGRDDLSAALLGAGSRWDATFGSGRHNRRDAL